MTTTNQTTKLPTNKTSKNKETNEQTRSTQPKSAFYHTCKIRGVPFCGDPEIFGKREKRIKNISSYK